MLSGKKISDLLLQVYDMHSGVSFEDHICSVLKDHIPASIVDFTILSLKNRQVEFFKAWDLRTGTLLDSDAIMPRLEDHPFLDYFFENRGGPVISTSDILSEEEWVNTALYQKLHADYGVIHDTAVRIYADDCCMIFSVTDSKVLPTEYRRMLNLLAPHLDKAYRLYQQQTRGIAGSLPDCMLLLAGDGSLVSCSERARCVLDLFFPKEAWELGLPRSLTQWVQAELVSMQGHERCVSGNRMNVTQLEQQVSFTLIRHEAGYLVLMEAKESATKSEVLMKTGLTRREAEVLSWVILGKQNSEIASILSIKTATVRKHMENIFRKYHCETRGAAARIAMQETGSA